MFRLKSIGKTLVNVPKDIRFYTILMKTIVSVVVESQKSKGSITNYDKKRRSVLLAQRVKGFLVRMGKRKKTYPALIVKKFKKKYGPIRYYY